MMQEDTCILVELVWLFGCEETQGAALCQAFLHISVPLEIFLKTLGNIIALRNNRYAFWDKSLDLVYEQRVVRASKDNGVDGRIQMKHLIYFLFYKIVGTRFVGLVVFYQWNPHRAWHPRDFDVGVQLGYFQFVGVGTYGARCGKYANVSCVGYLAYAFCGGAYDTQDTAIGVYQWKVVLLDGSEGLC